MRFPMTIGQVLVAGPYSEYKQGLLDRYFGIVFNERDEDPQIAKEMFQAFPLVVLGSGMLLSQGRN